MIRFFIFFLFIGFGACSAETVTGWTSPTKPAGTDYYRGEISRKIFFRAESTPVYIWANFGYSPSRYQITSAGFLTEGFLVARATWGQVVEGGQASLIIVPVPTTFRYGLTPDLDRTLALGGDYDGSVAWAPYANQFQTYTATNHLEVILSPNGDQTIVDLDIPQKKYGSGVLFIDNAMGIEQKGKFGDEDLTLKPGYNAIPFTGEIDANGLPKAMPSNWALTKTIGPDGQVYWSGRVSPPIEPGGAPVWAGVGGIAILPGASGSGPVIKLPNASNPALYDYVTLPAGMTRGSNNTLPGGMTAGSPGLPPGVTPGSAGALPNGTLSGGTAYLPPNVSPGTTSSVFVGGPTPGGFPGVNGTGVTATTSGPSTQGESGGYIPGASMDGMLERGVAQGQAAARKITTEFSDAANAVGGRAGAIYGSGTRGLAAGYWGVGAGAAAVGGADRSWLSVTIPIAQYSIPLTIPPYWIDLIRSILVWGVKIWFVVAVLKLLMR